MAFGPTRGTDLLDCWGLMDVVAAVVAVVAVAILTMTALARVAAEEVQEARGLLSAAVEGLAAGVHSVSLQ